MELFSEIYSCYYQVLRHLLSGQSALTIQDIRSRICREGFEESLLSIIPKIEDGTWNLFQKDGGLYLSRRRKTGSMWISITFRQLETVCTTNMSPPGWNIL